MRRLLGTLAATTLATLLLAGCGDETGGSTADDPAPDPGSTTTGTPTATTDPEPEPPSATDLPTRLPPITPSTGPAQVSFELVALEHATAVGGRVDPAATPVGPGGDTEAVLGQLTDPQFREVVEQAITSARVPGDLYAAVVAVGCDVPPGVTVTEAGDGYAIVADKVPDPVPECFAPVTTVAVVAVRS